ncbi:MAG TPA: asparagine synthase C-terminal domain-containing protein, partial [Chroococcales cyanobacterium]
ARWTENEAREQLVELLERSVNLRLISDVPLGIFLSGGIDSSAIAALAQKNSTTPIKTFSIGFADRSFDESAHAQAVATHLGTEHQVVEFEPNLAFETMEELWQTLDEPMADASILPTFFLSKMTRKSVTVALAGEGGDELFGGYPTYQAHRMAAVWNMVPQAVRENVIKPGINSLPVSHNNLTFDYKLKRFIAGLDSSPSAVARHLRWMGSIPHEEHRSLLRPELYSADAADSQSCIEKALGASNFTSARGIATRDLVDTVMQLDMHMYLPDDLLVKSDRASMAASLEVRLPFLAFPLVEFALSLPSDYKVRGLTTKYLLKKAIAPYLPKRTINRPKKGFGIPVAKWLNNDFRSLVDEFLSKRFIERQGIFQWQYISTLVDEHTAGRVDRRKELWTILMFQRWWSKFFAQVLV